MPCLPRCGILWVFFITYGCLGWVDKIRSSCGHDRRGLWPISFQPAAELRDQAKLGKLSYRELFLVGFFLLRTNIAEPCDRRLEVREIRGKDQVSRSRYFQGMRQHKGRRIQGWCRRCIGLEMVRRNTKTAVQRPIYEICRRNHPVEMECICIYMILFFFFGRSFWGLRGDLLSNTFAPISPGPAMHGPHDLPWCAMWTVVWEDVRLGAKFLTLAYERKTLGALLAKKRIGWGFMCCRYGVFVHFGYIFR